MGGRAIDGGVLLDNGTNIPNDLLVGALTDQQVPALVRKHDRDRGQDEADQDCSNAVRIWAARKLSEQDAEEGQADSGQVPDVQEQDAEIPGLLAGPDRAPSDSDPAARRGVGDGRH